MAAPINSNTSNCALNVFQMDLLFISRSVTRKNDVFYVGDTQTYSRLLLLRSATPTPSSLLLVFRFGRYSIVVATLTSLIVIVVHLLVTIVLSFFSAAETSTTAIASSEPAQGAVHAPTTTSFNYIEFSRNSCFTLISHAASFTRAFISFHSSFSSATATELTSVVGITPTTFSSTASEITSVVTITTPSVFAITTASESTFVGGSTSAASSHSHLTTTTAAHSHVETSSTSHSVFGVLAFCLIVAFARFNIFCGHWLVGHWARTASSVIATSSGWLLVTTWLHFMVAVSLLIVIVLWWAIVLHLLRMAIVTSDALVTVVTTASHWCASFKTSTSSWLWVVSVIVVAWSTHVATLVISAPAATLVVVSLLAIVLLFKS